MISRGAPPPFLNTNEKRNLVMATQIHGIHTLTNTSSLVFVLLTLGEGVILLGKNLK